MRKKSTNRYFRVGGVFVRTFLAGRRRIFSEPLSGGKRKTFKLGAFCVEAWKVAAGRKRLNPQSFLVMEAGSKYVDRIDDILDQVGGPSIATDLLKYKKDSTARESISQFVKQVKSSSLEKPQEKEMFRLVRNFRRSARAALIEFEKTPKPTVEDILKMKERTSGNLGRLWASMLNVCEGIPQEKRRELEDAFSNFFMAVQIVDDIFDVRIDHEKFMGGTGVLSIALGVLKEHPMELEKALRKRGIGMGWFRKNCPESHKELKGLFENYLSKIPKTTIGLQTLATIPRVFWKMPSFTRR